MYGYILLAPCKDKQIDSWTCQNGVGPFFLLLSHMKWNGIKRMHIFFVNRQITVEMYEGSL